MQPDADARLAVLIDADNVPAKYAKELFDEIATLGQANIRRIYGDFTSTHVAPWNGKLVEFALIPKQQFAYVKDKNASDIAMVIDAMDLLHKGGVDGFCLVSSDSDFTRLASRIREEGALVYGFGERQKIERKHAFPNACTRFVYLENLVETVDAPAASGAGDAKPQKEPPSKAVPILLKAIVGLEDDDGWSYLGAVNQRIPGIAPDFDPRSYGCSKLIDLVRKSGGFDIERPGGNGGAVKIRAKKQKSRAKK